MSSALIVTVIEGGRVCVEGTLVTSEVAKLNTDNIFEQVVLGQVSLDLENVENTDTAGLAWVVFFVGKIKCSGKSISIVKPPSQLLKLAEISELTTCLPLSD